MLPGVSSRLSAASLWMELSLFVNGESFVGGVNWRDGWCCCDAPYTYVYLGTYKRAHVSTSRLKERKHSMMGKRRTDTKKGDTHVFTLHENVKVGRASAAQRRGTPHPPYSYKCDPTLKGRHPGKCKRTRLVEPETLLQPNGLSNADK